MKIENKKKDLKESAEKRPQATGGKADKHYPKKLEDEAIQWLVKYLGKNKQS